MTPPSGNLGCTPALYTFTTNSTKPVSSSLLVGVYLRSTGSPSAPSKLIVTCCPTGSPSLWPGVGRPNRNRRVSWDTSVRAIRGRSTCDAVEAHPSGPAPQGTSAAARETAAHRNACVERRRPRVPRLGRPREQEHHERDEEHTAGAGGERGRARGEPERGRQALQRGVHRSGVSEKQRRRRRTSGHTRSARDAHAERQQPARSRHRAGCSIYSLL